MIGKLFTSVNSIYLNCFILVYFIFFLSFKCACQASKLFITFTLDHVQKTKVTSSSERLLVPGMTQREYPKYCTNDYLNQNSCETSTSLQIVYDVFTEDISHDPREKK